LERMGGFDLEARAQKVAAGLGFRPEDLARPVETLSGGWMMRAALARLLLAEPDVLLLDEPTNHLDLEALIWIENYLLASKTAVVLVSHDRAFLDHLVSRIVELDGGELTVYPGDYERYLEEKERRRREQWAAWEAQQERIAQIQRFVDRNRARKDRARQVQARLKLLEKMERVEPPSRPPTFHFQFPEPQRSGDIALELQGLAKSFGARRLYAGLDLLLQRGERLVLLGANGSGKTTLLSILADRQSPDAGEVRHGANVRVGYFAQDLVAELDGSRSLLEEVASVAGMEVTQGQLRTLLGAFLFSGEEVLKRVSVLSGGERSRLALCKLLIEAPNLLLLDEPTNHLDIESRDMLEQALMAYRGTLIMATHDRRLMNSVASKVLAHEDGQWRLYSGNYDDWLRLGASAGGRPAPKDPPPSDPEAPKKGRRADREIKLLEAQWRQQRSRRTAPLRSRLEEMLSRIEAAEVELAGIEAQLAQVETYADQQQARTLNARRVELKTALDRHLVPEWEQAAEEMEEMERLIEAERPR
ncbi:MAG: ABC-F family ATP-binding cassette domain-containing protein, partial [Pseudomonadota bacterium]